MISSRISLALVLACAIAVPLIQVDRAAAIDRYWQGDVNGTYGGSAAAMTAGNWDSLGGTGTLSSPKASEGERAVIGTDVVTQGVVNSDLAPFGSPSLATGAQRPGGIALGIRQLDYADADFDGITNEFLNPNPGAGNLIGKLTLTATGTTAANLISEAAPGAGDVAVGADGRVLVGVDGRGYLTMSGGTAALRPTLQALALVEGGENITTNAGMPSELGPSLIDLSGFAKVNITPGTTGVADLSRRIKVTGPDVQFNATGRIRFLNTSLYTAVITSATAQSPLVTANNGLLNGSLAIEFSGAGATRDPVTSIGQTWNLLDSTLSQNAIDGNFTNLGPGGIIQPTGLDAAHSAPLGANYRVKKVGASVMGVNHTFLQLSYEQTLVLTVNRDTGEISIRNPLAGHIAIDSYSVNSARGSMLASYNGLGAATPNAGVWVKPTAPGGNTVNALSEVKEPDNTIPIGHDDAYDLFPVPSVSLGTGFSRTGVGANIANFGFDGEDLIFEYSGPSTGTVLRGQIEYIGTKFENDLVLRVNPNTGQAFIKNDSLVTLKFDGYSVLSSTGALDGAGFTGLGGGWQTSSPPTANALSQTNLSGFTTLAPGAQLAIGDISSTNFTTAAAQAGLSVKYLLSEGVTPVNPSGDYNNDGTVNALDYIRWRDNLGGYLTLPNQSPLAITRSLVDQEDYNFWKANFGAVSGLAPDTTFRTGSIMFDATAGAGGGGLAGSPVPEPSACLLMLVGLGSVGLVRRTGKRHAEQQSVRAAGGIGILGELGANTMSKRSGVLMTALAGICAVLFTALPAAATTQGIPLTNGDFSLPGPIGTKVVAFDATGLPFAPTDPVVTLSSGQLAGGIPGWTFTGGSGIAATGETNPGHGNANPPDFGDQLPGDSGTEGVGGGLADNEMLLSTFDGKALQTSSFNVVSIPTTQKYQIAFDTRNIFTRGTTIDMIGPRAQLTARLYYVDAGLVKQTIGSPLVLSRLSAVVRAAFEFHGNVPAEMALLAPAMGHPIGIEFDTTSFESDPTRVTDSWLGIDNVIMQITGIKRGDFDGDGDIDATDYATLRDNQQEAHTYEFEGELTGDYFVDLNDFRVFKALFAAQGAGAGAGGGLAGAGVPEPSSLLLVLLGAVGIAGSTFRRRFAMPCRVRMFLAAAIALAATCAVVKPASATLLVYDPFNVGNNPASGQYHSFTPTPSPDPMNPVPPISDANPLVRLLGQNPTVGPTSFFNGAWTDVAGNTPTQFVQTTPLVYKGISSGGSVTTIFDNINNPTRSSGEGREGRYLTTPWTSMTVGTYYLSFLAAYGTVTDPNTSAGADLGFRTTEIWPEGGTVGTDTGRFEIGYQGFAGDADQQVPKTARLHFTGPGTNGYQYLTDTTFNEDSNLTHLIVLKAVLATGNNTDTVSLFLDPTDTTEPIVPSAIAPNINFTMTAISTISVFGTATGIRPAFDDLRVSVAASQSAQDIAAAYAEALPPLPKPGDTNGDNLIDLVDYQAIISHMNLLGQPLANGDVTGDGKVTIADYRFWKDRYPTPPGAGAGAGPASGVPEPSTWTLALVATLCWRCGRRRCRD